MKSRFLYLVIRKPGITHLESTGRFLQKGCQWALTYCNPYRSRDDGVNFEFSRNLSPTFSIEICSLWKIQIFHIYFYFCGMFVLPTLILTFSIYNFPELDLGQKKKKKLLSAAVGFRTISSQLTKLLRLCI